MIVQGYQVPDSVIEAAMVRMKCGLHFRAFEIEGVVQRAGVPAADGLSMRVADRIIQRERKAGTIAIIKTPQRCWEWVGPK